MELPSRARQGEGLSFAVRALAGQGAGELLLYAAGVKEVISGVRHERLLTDVGCNRATVRRGRAALGIQSLNEGHLGQGPTARRPMFISNGLEQQASDRAIVGATRIGAGDDAFVHSLCPDLAAVEGTLPRGTSERQGAGGELIGVGIGAQKVRNDLELLPEDGRKEGSLRPCVVDGP